jgi:hypothetical protein
MADAHLPHEGRTANPDVHHETADVNVLAVLQFGAGLLAVVAIVHLLIWVFFGFLRGREAAPAAREYPLAATGQNRLPPEPRLQTSPRDDLRDLRALEDQLLTSYGWVDKNAGVVRIPIEEARKIVVEKGLPVRPGR